jgi:RNA polymerase sigma-70 factor (ECF subfamily)
LSAVAGGDLELARACARGDEAAWEEFGRRYFDFIRAFARRALAGAAAADLADQVIADLWQRGKIGRFEGRSTLKTWLAAVVAHAASNAAERQRRVVPLEDAGQRSADGPFGRRIQTDAGRLGRERLAALLAEATARLEAPDRLLLLLYYDQGLTLEEMVPLLRRSKAVLSRRLKRVTAALRAELESRSRERFGASARELVPDLESPEIDLASLLAAQQKSGAAVQEKGEGA